ncbi:unnamed protein product [Somion occarium]|uniref:Uncharacterized protein n=1 Tax=Somion occarium TaxID=3059160 RepID=A0ABP1CR27_9APHY
MSLGDADAKFPGNTDSAIPPSPSRENPGQVYPKSDPQGRVHSFRLVPASLLTDYVATAAPVESVPGTGGEHEPGSFFGNPYAFDSVFGKLEHALNETISAVENEGQSVGASSNENAMLQKLRGWRTELDILRSGKQGFGRVHRGTPQEGGMFTD